MTSCKMRDYPRRLTMREYDLGAVAAHVDI